MSIEILKQIDKSKIEITGNKNLIPMKLFLSFLTVETIEDMACFGYKNGWTKHTGDNGLIISGGVVNGTECLDNLKYGKYLDNPYNNFVNPFYLLDIMNKDGWLFFLDYYAKDIEKIYINAMDKEAFLKAQAKQAEQDKKAVFDFFKSIEKACGK